MDPKSKLSDLVAEITWRELIISKLVATKETFLIICVLIIAWLLSLLNIILFSDGFTKNASIQPRKTLLPLFSILWSFILHDNLGTLVLNSLFYVISSLTIMSIGIFYMVIFSLVTILASGLFVWCIGFSSESYFGLSVLILSYGSFAATYSFLSSDWKIPGLIGIASSLLYIGIGLRGAIYWESSLMAVIIGSFEAYYFMRYVEKAFVPKREDGSAEEAEKLVDDVEHS